MYGFDWLSHRNSQKCFLWSLSLSKRPLWEKSHNGGFDRFNHQTAESAPTVIELIETSAVWEKSYMWLQPAQPPKQSKTLLAVVEPVKTPVVGKVL